jgi:TonB family protein
MRSYLFLLIAMLALSGSGAGATDLSLPVQIVPLKAVGPWHLDEGANSCTVSRPFTDASRPVYLAFKPSPAGDSLQIYILSSNTFTAVPKNDAEISFGDSAPLRGFISTLVSKAGAQNILSMHVDDRNLTLLSQSSVLSLRAGANRFSFSTGSMKNVVGALRACVSDLLVTWGEDKTTQDMIAVPASGSVLNAVGVEDYPSGALSANEQGAVGFHFWVGTDGKANQCVVVQSSGSNSLDSTTCAIVNRRVRYIPAKDASGQSIRSLIYAVLVWAIPTN